MRNPRLLCLLTLCLTSLSCSVVTQALEGRAPATEAPPAENELPAANGTEAATDAAPGRDGLPPAIEAVSIRPEIVRNGDTVQIEVQLGEPGALVTADVSRLDLTMSAPVILQETGDGFYTGSFTISYANQTENGQKTVAITAADSTGNWTRDIAQVTYQNPAPVLDRNPPGDSFTGTVLDTQKWRQNVTGGSLWLDDGVFLATDGLETNTWVGVYSTWKFIGDFDFQLTYRIRDGWREPSQGTLFGPTLSVHAGTDSYASAVITRYRVPGRDYIFPWASSSTMSGETPITALALSLRMIRVGSRIWLFYRDGAQWIEMGSNASSIEPAGISFNIGTENVAQAFSARFYDLKINNGITNFAGRGG